MSERRTSLIGGLLVAIGPISLALYTPAMPVLVEMFGATESLVKLTLTAYFAGFAVTQLICGPLSDALGRRIITLVFMATYLGGSLIAVLASTPGWFRASAHRSASPLRAPLCATSSRERRPRAS